MSLHITRTMKVRIPGIPGKLNIKKEKNYDFLTTGCDNVLDQIMKQRS